MGAPHTLLFLDPGHFHAALTLRVQHPRVAEEVVVYGPDGAERRDFLALVERFNRRPEAPTRWRPAVVTTDDPLARLVDERRGDVVVVAGRTGGKARAVARLHAAGFHVLADKPWLVGPEDLDAVRASLAGWPLAVEIMTGRHDLAARLLKRLVDVPAIFGGFRGDASAITLDSVHHLAKLVDGTPLRRPWWFFDVREQGTGAVDIPTHLVDQAQWLLDATGVPPGEVPALLSARVWPTRVPAETFAAITGLPGFPPALAPFVADGVLDYRCNTDLQFRLGGVSARAAARWALSVPPRGGDEYRVIARGAKADVRLEQGAHTGHRRQLTVRCRDAAATRALLDRMEAWQAELPGIRAERVGAERYEVRPPPGLDGGHESHFSRVLAELLDAIDERRWPAATAERTLAKYTLLATAAGVTAGAGA